LYRRDLAPMLDDAVGAASALEDLAQNAKT
jgi:hypothetical protein